MEDNNKEYSELFEIGDYENDYFLIFGNGHAFIPKVKKKYITNEFIPHMIIRYFDYNDYKKEYPIELYISLYDYKIIFPKYRNYNNFEWESFKAWLFSFNKKFHIDNRTLCMLKWNELNQNKKYNGDLFSKYDFIYSFEKKILKNYGIDKKYKLAEKLFHPIAEYNLCKNVRFWMVYENNPIEVLKEPHIRVFYTDDYKEVSIDLAISLLSNKTKVIYENSNDYYKNNINEYKKKKKYILNVFNKWKIDIESVYLSCSNLDNARKLWAMEHQELININFPSIWKRIKNY